MKKIYLEEMIGFAFLALNSINVKVITKEEVQIFTSMVINNLKEKNIEVKLDLNEDNLKNGTLFTYIKDDNDDDIFKLNLKITYTLLRENLIPKVDTTLFAICTKEAAICFEKYITNMKRSTTYYFDEDEIEIRDALYDRYLRNKITQMRTCRHNELLYYLSAREYNGYDKASIHCSCLKCGDFTDGTELRYKDHYDNVINHGYNTLNEEVLNIPGVYRLDFLETKYNTLKNEFPDKSLGEIQEIFINTYCQKQMVRQRKKD